MTNRISFCSRSIFRSHPICSMSFRSCILLPIPKPGDHPVLKKSSNTYSILFFSRSSLALELGFFWMSVPGPWPSPFHSAWPLKVPIPPSQQSMYFEQEGAVLRGFSFVFSVKIVYSNYPWILLCAAFELQQQPAMLVVSVHRRDWTISWSNWQSFCVTAMQRTTKSAVALPSKCRTEWTKAPQETDARWKAAPKYGILCNNQTLVRRIVGAKMFGTVTPCMFPGSISLGWCNKFLDARIWPLQVSPEVRVLACRQDAQVPQNQDCHHHNSLHNFHGTWNEFLKMCFVKRCEFQVVECYFLKDFTLHGTHLLGWQFANDLELPPRQSVYEVQTTCVLSFLFPRAWSSFELSFWTDDAKRTKRL